MASANGTDDTKRKEIAKKTIERLKNFTEHLESGVPVSEIYSCRKVMLNIELEPYTPQMVQEVRALLNVSQALFAKFLNVSASAVRKWEQGFETPKGAVCRLMDEIRYEPDYWRKRFKSMLRTVSATGSK